MSFSLQTLFAGVTISAVFLGGFCLSRNDGRLVKTGKPLDLAIMGEGYFRSSSRIVTELSTLVTAIFISMKMETSLAAPPRIEGFCFLGSHFHRCAIPVITPEGSTQCYDVGQPEQMTSMATIQLASVPNPEALRQVADDLYEATNESGTPMSGQPGSYNFGLLRPGYLEREPSGNWFADVKPLYVLLLGIAVVGGWLLLREMRAQRRELAKLQMLMSNPVPPGTC